jgi:hypothetical protein
MQQWWSVVVSRVVAALAVAGLPAVAAGQTNLPWDSFQDPASGEVCDVINAANAELVLYSATGELVIVTGDDIFLENSVVDSNAQVFIDGEPMGIIGFYTDGDGERTLWWTTLTGRVVAIDDFTGVPSGTDDFPSDFDGAPCDACPFWDDPDICEEPDVVGGISVNICGTGVEVPVSLSLMSLALVGFCRRRG